ncbi:MAG: 50S ribosomal protein L4 [Candidatus Levybacteria bacterium]|nr:50S ribosomal protein L4 [Candidatus Levybacteria bacterium]
MAIKKISKVKVQKSKIKVKAKKLVKKTTVKKVIKAAKAAIKPAVSAKGRVEARIPVSSPKKAVNFNVSVFDTKGKVAGYTELPVGIFGAKINNSLMSQAVRVYLANQRQGTSKTKNRGEVNRTTKKIYQQKGTGRARHGSRRAPIFVGGGRVFGPTPRDLSLSISKKMKTLALFSALSSKLKDSEVKIIKGLEAILPKTKLMVEVLRNLEIASNKRILLIMPKAGKESENVYRAARNIEGTEIISANSLNTYRVLDNDIILIMKDSIDTLKNTFVKN